MALTIETGAGDNPLADSYASEQQLLGYAANRGIELTGDPGQLLLRAMDYSESLSFSGRKVSADQPLQWPRTGVRIEGYTIPSDTIPAALVRAQIVTAIAIDEGRDPLTAIEPAVTSEKVDVLAVTYSDSGVSSTINVDINRAFAKLLGAGGAANQIPVYRG